MSRSSETVRLRRRGAALLGVAALVGSVVAGVSTTPALAHEEHGQTLEDAGTAGMDAHQHGENDGHLPASSSNVALVGKIDTLTDVKGGIADVSAFGNYAYLNAFSPECAGRTPQSRGTGTHVVDISDPSHPRKVAFLAAEPNSYVGEGVHVINFRGRSILLNNNETCDSDEPVISGFSLWDVTNPTSAAKLGQFGDVTPAIPGQTFHTTHSVQGFVWRDRAYAVAQDNQELKDVDIFDITPAITGAGSAVLVAERGLEDWPGAQGSYANGDSVFHHDMQQKVINGHNFLLASYWDAGQVLLNIDDPANPVFVTDSDFTSPDPETGFEIPEGNSHQSYWDQDGDFVISTDEDFSPTRTQCRQTTGTPVGDTPCGEFGWTVPLGTAFPNGVEGSTVFGGSGCPADANGNGTADASEVPPRSLTGADWVVFTRGGCFFSDKVRAGEDAGYRLVAIGNHHAGSRNGFLPDAFICGSQGSDVRGTASAICLGHRKMHELFNDPPSYTGPQAFEQVTSDMPLIGTRGGRLSARGGVFDGWGYAHLHDAKTLAEIDTYAIPEAINPAYAKGFGNLTVHEVKTDMRPKKDLAYFSWYAGGLRVASFDRGGIREVGHYIAEGGNDFWGVFPHCVGACAKSDKDQGSGKNFEKRPLLLMSDRDSGLWILRYTGKE